MDGSNNTETRTTNDAETKREGKKRFLASLVFPKGTVRKLWMLLLSLLVLLFAVLAVGPKVMDSVSGRHISHLLEEYRTKPTKELCEKLTRLLDGQKVETELGNEILKELATPLLRTRSAYNVDKPVHFSMTRRFALRFPHMKVSNEEYVETEDDFYGGRGSGGNGINNQPQFLHYHPAPDKPGDYKAQVRYRHELTPDPQTTVGRNRRRATKSDEPVYQCEFIIPVELKVVPKEQAESVELVSTPNLDAKMKRAFTTQPFNETASYGAPSGRRRSTGGTYIVFEDCPADAAFQMSFRFENGEVKVMPTSKRFRQGTSGKIHVSLLELAIERTGTHRGTLVLTPDSECAYIDPDIQSIWAGSLEFPMSVTVTQDE